MKAARALWNWVFPAVFYGVFCPPVPPALAGDWREQITPAPGSFPPLRPLEAQYSFGWSAFSAGRAETEFSRTKEGDFQLKLTGRSIGAVRTMWRMDSEATSLVSAATLLPVKLVQKETYKDETRMTTVIYGPEGAQRTRVTKPAEGPVKTKKFKFAPVHDLQSALLFVRSQPLRQGEVVRMAVYPAAQGYFAEVEVLGREEIAQAGRKWPAIKLALRLQSITKELALARHEKFKRATAWLSDDRDRLLLKIESEVMVGRVWMDLESVTFPADKNKAARE